MRIAPIAIVTVLAGSAALAADQAPPFAFSPVPRWQLPADQEPETDQICAAVRKECPALKGVEYIHAPFGYDEVFDADGHLVGLRMTQSTGCAPIDESMLISQRKFKTTMQEGGQTDFDPADVPETAPGPARDAIRISKPDTTELSLRCDPD
ncbi:hypothetical protein [Novosphingobium sp.]|uniref:hypothetical protein n=1 Tax=Novosphingobium sp. TaxID=1874826 RepID=UPI00333E6713